MSFGIVEIVTLLLSLAGFGISPDPKAASADQALEYAMPDADLVVHVDVGAVIPNNYKVLTGLADQPGIKNSPELSQMVRQVVTEVEAARGMAKTATGLDIITDITDATGFVQIVPGRDPNMVIVAHGKFGPQVVEKIAATTHKSSTKVGGGLLVELDKDAALGLTKSNVLVFGQTANVRARVADTWKAPARPKDTILAYSAEVISQKPVYAVVAALSQGARNEILSKHSGPPNFATDMLKRHKLAAFSLYANGIGWNWIDSKPDGVDQIATMSEGLVELFRAGQIAPRGLAKIMMAGLESYRGTDKRIDELLAQKDNLLKIVASFTGDGQFKATVDKQKAANRLNVRLTGKSVSEVVPFALAFPAIGATLFVRGKAETAPPPPPVAKPVAPPRPPKPPGTGLTH